MAKEIIFISHIQEDAEIAKETKSLLQEKFLGMIDVFVSAHGDSIGPGKEWNNTIKNAIINCKMMIIVCTPESIARPWINFEAGSGWVKNIDVIPLCCAGLTKRELKYSIAIFQCVEFNSDDIKGILKSIANILNCDTPELNNTDFIDKIKIIEVKNKTSVNNKRFYTVLSG